MIDGIPPAPAGEPELRLTVWRDAAGPVRMSIRESRSGLNSGEISLHRHVPAVPAPAPGRETGAPGGVTAAPGGVTIASETRTAAPRKIRGMTMVLVVLGLCAVGAALFLLLQPGGKLPGEQFSEKIPDRTSGLSRAAPDAGVRRLQESEGERGAGPGEKAGAAPGEKAGAGEVGRYGAGGEKGAEPEGRPGREEIGTGPPPEREEAGGDSSPGQAETPAGDSAGRSAGMKEAEAYRIRPGDTMWDLSGRFYGDPMLYPSLARYNRVFNPDLIISGDSLLLPPRVEDRERR
jgi:hypothetical protein